MTGIHSPPLSLVADQKAEHEELFRALFAEHFRDLLGYALRRVAAPEDAAYVVAETMLVAWRRLEEVPTDGTERLWLYGVARRVLSNYRRGEIRRSRLGERLRQHLVAAAPDPADAVASNTAIREALGRLFADDRELLELTVWEGLAPQEVAAVLGVASGTVLARLHRARRKLRTELGDAFEVAGHTGCPAPAPRSGGRTMNDKELDRLIARVNPYGDQTVAHLPTGGAEADLLEELMASATPTRKPGDGPGKPLIPIVGTGRPRGAPGDGWSRSQRQPRPPW